jgi:hypothetical protein
MRCLRQGQRPGSCPSPSLPARQSSATPNPTRGSLLREKGQLTARSPRGPSNCQVATRPVATLTYSLSPGFAAMDEAQLSADFYGFLRSIVPNPGHGMWYASTQSFGNRLEAIALAVGADCLLVANGVQPMQREGVSADGRVRLRRAGPWDIDYVRLPFQVGTCHVSALHASRNTLAGGTRPDMDTHPEIARELSNLPASVQDHLESYVPAALRVRRWVRALGPTALKPERLWLFTTSQDQLAYVHGERWQRADPSGLARNAAEAPPSTGAPAAIGPFATGTRVVDDRSPSATAANTAARTASTTGNTWPQVKRPVSGRRPRALASNPPSAPGGGASLEARGARMVALNRISSRSSPTAAPLSRGHRTARGRESRRRPRQRGVKPLGGAAAPPRYRHMSSSRLFFPRTRWAPRKVVFDPRSAGRGSARGAFDAGCRCHPRPPPKASGHRGPPDHLSPKRKPSGHADTRPLRGRPSPWPPRVHASPSRTGGHHGSRGA